MPAILPALAFEEALETTHIHSIGGLLRPGEPMVVRQPFRSSNHGISRYRPGKRWVGAPTRENSSGPPPGVFSFPLCPIPPFDLVSPRYHRDHSPYPNPYPQPAMISKTR
ncbi:MAG: ATP-binding protein [bacterium]